MNLNAVIEYGAVISAAIYGVLLAHRKGLDFVGVFAVAFVVSFGGGTLRDLFLDRTPLFWVANQHFAIMVFTLALAGRPARQKRRPVTEVTMPTHTPLFATLLTGIVLVLAALTFFPALALGPLAEALS
mgnify:CR=1 FL=1